MGALTYEHVRCEFDDRVLAHLQHVIYNKLRRGESMAFSWAGGASSAPRRTSVWVHPAASIVFEFSGDAGLELNRNWLDRLSVAANSPAGLHVVPEPTDQDASR